MLFDGFSNSAVSFANRIVMAPMTRCRADHRDAVPNAMMVEYYRQRASAGMIISEGVPVSDRGRGYIHTGALWNEAQAAGWKKVNDAVHAAGGKMFAQLWHVGRISHSALHVDHSAPAGVSGLIANSKTFIPGAEGAPIFSPCEAPVELSTAEAAAIPAEFGNSARMARLAGFDGVEIHGANGYLLDQFRCPFLNQRKDKYGGTLENRYRLLLEAVDAVAAVYDPTCISVRQSPYGVANDIQADPDPLGTYTYIAKELDRRRIGFLHLNDQNASWIHDAKHPLLPALRQAYRGAIIACGGFNADNCEDFLKRGQADLIGIGKLFISNPDLVERLKRGAELAAFDQKTFYAGAEKGYLDYPKLAA
ncbi:MAG: alkene reductase [Proteobacteria bacterium]|nr:alkene reductase [Pseudomonadota bacterium]